MAAGTRLVLSVRLLGCDALNMFGTIGVCIAKYSVPAEFGIGGNGEVGGGGGSGVIGFCVGIVGCVGPGP